MAAIQISPPCSEEWWESHKDQQPILRRDKYVARESPYGPYGYGNTAEEAFHDLIHKLHAQIDAQVGYLYNERGLTDRPLEARPRKYVPMEPALTYYCDGDSRHLVCVPYSIENLHKMADHLGIKRAWFHKDHYDIPKKRIYEIMQQCELADSKRIVEIIRGKYPDPSHTG